MHGEMGLANDIIAPSPHSPDSDRVSSDDRPPFPSFPQLLPAADPKAGIATFFIRPRLS